MFEGPRTLHGEVLERRFHGRRVIRLWTDDGSPVDARRRRHRARAAAAVHQARRTARDDRDRYQTVFARARGSVAAPTAGLHFTPALLDGCAAPRRRDRARSRCTSATGRFSRCASSRSKITASSPSDTKSTPAAADAIGRALRDGRRVVAVGTTTTRTLEAVARQHDGRIVAGSGDGRSCSSIPASSSASCPDC